MKILAPFISFFAYRKHFGLRSAMWAAIEMLTAVGMALLFEEDRTPKEMRVFRRKSCGTCAMRDPVLDTCGTPGVTSEDGSAAYGCWCPLTLATFVRGKECWMAQHGSDRWEGLS